jgi:predicted ATPase
MSTIELLSMLARRREAARLLILATSRQAELVVADHPLKTLKQELVTRRLAVEVRLPYLRVAAVQAYVAQQLGEAGAGEETLAQVIYQRTDGHPLFMVQMTSYLAEQGESARQSLAEGVQEIPLPQGLRELIELQMRRLTVEEQTVLHAASVAGVEFAAVSVAAGIGSDGHAVETVCEQLAQRGQFLTEQEVQRWPDGTMTGRYRFRHAIYQEVLYQQLSASRRVRLHQQIGEREERGYGERSKEVAAELAMHFERAQDYQRAVQYLRWAGENAVRRNAQREALTLFARGLTLLSTLPETVERDRTELALQLAIGPVLLVSQSQGAEQLERTYTRAQQLALRLGETRQLFHTLAGLRRFHSASAHHRHTRVIGEQMLAVAGQLDDPTILIEAHYSLGMVAFLLGELPTARVHLEQALTRYESPQAQSQVQSYGLDLGILVWSYLMLTLWLLGYIDEAEHRRREAFVRAEALAHPPSWVHLHLFTCMFSHVQRHVPALQEQVTRLVTLATDEGVPAWLAGGVAMQGWVDTVHEQGETGVALLQEGLTGLRTVGQMAWYSYFLALLAEGYSLVQQPEEGLRTVAEARGFIEQTDERFYEAEVWRLRGELVLQQAKQKSKGKVQKLKEARGWRLETSSSPQAPSLKPLAPSGVEQEVEECFLKAIDIARQQQAKSLELRAVMSLVRLRQQQVTDHATRNTQSGACPALTEAHSMLAEVYGWFTEGFDTKDLQEAKALLAAVKETA